MNTTARLYRAWATNPGKMLAARSRVRTRMYPAANAPMISMMEKYPPCANANKKIEGHFPISLNNAPRKNISSASALTTRKTIAVSGMLDRSVAVATTAVVSLTWKKNASQSSRMPTSKSSASVCAIRRSCPMEAEGIFPKNFFSFFWK